MKSNIENIIGKKIVYWPENYNSSFQYVTEEMINKTTISLNGYMGRHGFDLLIISDR